MIPLPTVVLAWMPGNILTTLSLIFIVLCVAVFPVYVLEDVLDLAKPTAYAIGTVVWLVATLVFARSPYEALAAVLLYHTYGWNIESPLLLAGGVITVLHVLAAIEASAEKNDRTSAH